MQPAALPPPFAEFLEELRGHGFAVTVDRQIRAAALLEALGGEYRPERLATLLCPLFASNEREQRLFVELFERRHPVLSGRPVPVATVEAAPSKGKKRRARWIAIAAAMLLAGLGGWAVWNKYRNQGPNGEPAPEAPTTVTFTPPPRPTGPAPTYTPTVGVVITAKPAPGLPLEWPAASGAIATLLLGYFAWTWRWRRKAMLDFRAAGPAGSRPARGDRRSLTAEQRFPLLAAVRRLRRRELSEAAALDPEATVRDTIRALGFPTLRYRNLTRRPEYLVLVDKQSPYDHQAALLARPIEALRDQGLLAHVYFYARDPRVCHAEKSGRPSLLTDLRHKHLANRLVVLGDFATLLNTVEGRWSHAAEILKRWPMRVVLTPKAPAEWGAPEWFVASQFPVLPATADGLETLGAIWDGGRAGEGEARGESAPIEPPDAASRGVFREYVAALRGYLGESAFRCLAACAVYPKVRWDLTLRLAKDVAPELLEREADLLRLFRLAPFRIGWMAEEALQELERATDGGLRAKARASAAAFLNELVKADEAAPEDVRFEIVALRAGVDAAGMSEIRDDDVLARLVSAVPLDGWQLAVPERLRRLLFRHGLPALGIRRAVLAGLGVVALAGVAVFAMAAFTSAELEVVTLHPAPPPWMRVTGDTRVNVPTTISPAVTPAIVGERVTGETRVNPVDGLTYVWVGPGEFRMGCSEGDGECYDEEKPARYVRITRGFWIGKTEVTQAAYQRVMAENRSRFKGRDLPVERVDWSQARNYCAKAGLRLPAEAEWEYAARAGSTGARYGPLDAVAWYDKNSGGQTHAVGTKAPNAWGLHDMLGNVLEWTADWYDEKYYESGPPVDPQGAEPGTRRVLRGGSWVHVDQVPRVSVRGGGGPSVRSVDLGFRCAGEFR